VWFRCLKHREFGVSDTALKTRKNAEPEEWKRALKKAIERAEPGERRKFSTSIFKLATTNAMSALGHKRTYAPQQAMSALPPKADMCGAASDVRFGPKADI
jgi:hypothetical protein